MDFAPTHASVPADASASSWVPGAAETAALRKRYMNIRGLSVGLCEHLSAEDCQVQSLPEAAPAKWHLGHTTGFFETAVLATRPGYRPARPRFAELFGSPHRAPGSALPPGQRGLLSRPSLREVLDYRREIDECVDRALREGRLEQDALDLLELGLQHEQRHQERLLADLKHVLGSNPLLPAYRPLPVPAASAPLACDWIAYPEGFSEAGHAGDGFAFDNERPRHRVWLRAYALASRCVTNAEYREFIRAGGYRIPTLWLYDGWAMIQATGWARPLYWSEDCEQVYTLGGLRPLDSSEPVCHLSYYEAHAFARWAGARLPRETEWEHGARGAAVEGNFLETGRLHPRAPLDVPEWFGNVWQWTQSAHGPYPGYTPPHPRLQHGVANFTCSQFVLRGGSCVSSAAHLRGTYRHFLPPHARWHFSGLRLAKDLP